MQHATATITFIWDDRMKRWHVTGSRPTSRGAKTLKVDTSSPIDHEGLTLIMAAIQTEMLSWVY